MTMARYNRVVQDESGNGVAGAHIEVRHEIPGQPLAALYSDRAGTVGIGNPFDADSAGRFGFHAIAGAYQIRAYTGPSGAPTFEVILSYEPVGLAQETDAAAEGLVPRDAGGGGTVTVTNDDADIILVDGGSRVVMPAAEDSSKPARIVDGNLDAHNNNIVVVPARPHTVMMAVGTPGVVTLADHGRSGNDPVSFETTGALLTGLTADTQLYVKTVLSTSTFSVSETPGGAAIEFSGSQSGVHTMGTDTLMGAASHVIDGKGGSYKFTPRSDGTGWY